MSLCRYLDIRRVVAVCACDVCVPAFLGAGRSLCFVADKVMVFLGGNRTLFRNFAAGDALVVSRVAFLRAGGFLYADKLRCDVVIGVDRCGFNCRFAAFACIFRLARLGAGCSLNGFDKGIENVRVERFARILCGEGGVFGYRGRDFGSPADEGISVCAVVLSYRCFAFVFGDAVNGDDVGGKEGVVVVHERCHELLARLVIECRCCGVFVNRVERDVPAVELIAVARGKRRIGIYRGSAFGNADGGKERAVEVCEIDRVVSYADNVILRYNRDVSGYGVGRLAPA